MIKFSFTAGNPPQRYAKIIVGNTPYKISCSWIRFLEKIGAMRILSYEERQTLAQLQYENRQLKATLVFYAQKELKHNVR